MSLFFKVIMVERVKATRQDDSHAEFAESRSDRSGRAAASETNYRFRWVGKAPIFWGHTRFHHCASFCATPPYSPSWVAGTACHTCDTRVKERVSRERRHPITFLQGNSRPADSIEGTRPRWRSSLLVASRRYLMICLPLRYLTGYLVLLTGQGNLDHWASRFFPTFFAKVPSRGGYNLSATTWISMHEMTTWEWEII